MRDIVPLIRGEYYHIYNRGINGENIFMEERNYPYFLDKWFLNTLPVIKTYSYCLLKNHFHFLVSVKPEEVKVKNATGKDKILDPSKQISHCFNGYAQAFNKANNRHGGLLESPFRRNRIDDRSYFINVLAYIHFNPQKHKFCDDYRDYPYSSFNLHFSNQPVRIHTAEIKEWFRSKSDYLEFHENYRDFNSIEKYVEEDV